MREDHRPVTSAVKSLFEDLRSCAEAMRQRGRAARLDQQVLAARSSAGDALDQQVFAARSSADDAPAEVLWSGRPRYRWWHSPLFAFDFLMFFIGGLVLAAGSAFVLITGGLALGLLLLVTAVGLVLGSVSELRRFYRDRRERYYVLTEVSLKNRGVTSMDGAQLWAITRFELRRHRDGTGTISYWTRSGDARKLLRLEDADVVYLMLRQYIEAAKHREGAA